MNRKAGLVVPVNIALDELPIEMRWLKGKPMPKIFTETQAARITKLMHMGNR
ncbi:MAG: hypothetical protein F7B61_06510 [Caldisphaeraceae archaeon]|nr:hypothetical protein [Caldisphaeraceae archaeon]